MADDHDANAGNTTGGGRTLGGGAAQPIPAAWSRPTQAPRVGRVGDWSGNSGGGRSGSRFGTIGGLNSSRSGGGHASHGHRPGDDSDDDENEDRGEQYFAGGERSGLAIHNPGHGPGIPGGNMVRDLLRRAEETGPPPEDEDTSGPFGGGGHKLGGEDVESAYIPDPNARPEDEVPAIRHLTVWQDGITVEDGPLLRYDDPNNAELLAHLNAGRAPPSALNIALGQRVDIRVTKRTHEPYTPPQGTRAFAGSGNRLGAPVPNFGAESSASESSAMPGGYPDAAPGTSAVDRESVTARFEVDQTKPTTSVQIRLADGTRIVCRMNLTHTVRDLLNFINAARPENLTRPYTIGTTFPNRTLYDPSATIEGAGLVNSVVVQRWA
ncbi:hypothetical protein DXG03_006497 [Asterophora parasitica]|uniref:SEP-domain-containing protein n=1 Tax=Asterophora parasitica TaxID=117018 RepID=A0A9P7G871_9AGAR|nr:hypothetical protein DXG03_006497 [Asterophora parasitica]